MSIVNYGIIGFGGIAENRVAKEGFACDAGRFAPLGNARLVAAVDVNPARQAAAETLGLKWHSSIEEMLGDSSIQAVYVATNNRSHVSIARQALEAGRHVIVEKPMATRSADVQELMTLAASRGLSLSVDHMMVFNAWNRLAARTVAGGALGAVNDACFHMECAFGYDPAEAATWRCRSVDEMGGPIGDLASHCFYLAEYVLHATVKRLACAYYPKTMSIAAEDGAYVKACLDNGAQLSVRAAFCEPRGGLVGTLGSQGYEIFGDKAVLRAYGTMFQISGHPGEPYSQHLLLDAGNGAFQELLPDKTEIKNIYQQVISRHAKSILDGHPLDGDDAYHNIRLCELCHVSARAGGAIQDV